MNVHQEVPHSENQVTFKFTTTLDEAPENEAFGLRQFMVFVGACPKNCGQCSGPNPADCQRCIAPYQLKDGKCVEDGTWVRVASQFNTNDFTSTDPWIITGAAGTGAAISECGTARLVGGFNKFGKGAAAKRTFSNLQSHSRVKIIVEVWKIDSWDGEILFINVDGKRAW